MRPLRVDDQQLLHRLLELAEISQHVLDDEEVVLDSVCAGAEIELDVRARREHRHRAVFGLEPVGDMERLPRVRFFWRTLGDEIGITSGMPHGRVRHLAGTPQPYVPEDETDGTADSRIGAMAGTGENTLTAVEIEFLHHGTADDGQRSGPAGRALHTHQLERIVEHSFDCGDHHRQIFRQTARHDGVDRNFLDSRHALTRGHHTKHFLRIALDVIYHGADFFLRRRQYWQAVGPAIFIGKFGEIVDVRAFEDFRNQLHFAHAVPPVCESSMLTTLSARPSAFFKTKSAGSLLGRSCG